jgi:hypothetical protein
VPPLSKRFYILFFLKKIKISIFGGISKFLKLIVFGQILGIFSSLDSAAMGVANNMPSFEKRKRKRKAS